MLYTSASLSRLKDRKGKPWRGTLEYRDTWGNRKQIRKVFPETRLKKDAEKALNEWREAMEAKSRLSEYKGTVEDAIRAHLGKQHSLGQISITTYQNSLRLAEKSIFPTIGKILFSDVARKDVQKFVNELALTYRPQSVRTIFSILSKTYKAALADDEISIDPTAHTQLPKAKGGKINYLDKSGRKAFFDQMDENSCFFLPSMIAFYTGMRAGEICALRWEDVNLAKSVITVEKAAKTYKDDNGEKQVEISQTKNAKTRTIPIADQLLVILERSKTLSAEQGDEFVIRQRDPHLLCSSFLKWSSRHNVMGKTGRPISMHGLRHGFATMGVQSGMDVKSLSSILGHSSAAMTLDVYASSDEEAKQCAMRAFSKMLSTEEKETTPSI